MRNSLVDIEEPEEFCDEGPPGRYCLKDLSGWHDCHVEKGQMVDTIKYCPSHTRLGRQQQAVYVADDNENIIRKFNFAFLQLVLVKSQKVYKLSLN